MKLEKSKNLLERFLSDYNFPPSERIKNDIGEQSTIILQLDFYLVYYYCAKIKHDCLYKLLISDE